MSKKILAILMAVAMAFSLLPATALATTSGDDQQQSTLEPEAKHYNFDGTETTSGNPDITLTKTAVPVKGEDGVYEVTLTATTSQKVKPKPVEVVFVLDGSGSMGWCTENPPTGHNHRNGGWCSKTQNDHSKSRWNIAINAINQMVTNIGNDGVSYKYVLFQDQGWGWTDWKYHHKGYAITVNSYNEQSPDGSTYLTAGVKKGITEFSENSGADKVMIIVADGESDDKYPTSQATAFKNAGGKIYTVGFLFSGNKFNNLSSGDGYHFTADNADQINLAMNTITQNIAGLISDPMGENVALLQDRGISVKLGDQDTTAATVLNGNTIRWTKTDGFSGTVTMKYKVQVKDSAKTGKVLSIPLNDNATFNYVYNGTSHSVAFPQPVAQAAALTVSYKVGEKTVKTEEDYTLLGENAAFTTTIPSVGDEVEIKGTTYYVSSTDGSVPEELASRHYQVTVNLSETPPILGTVTVTVPDKTVTYNGNSQTGETRYTANGLSDGYTLSATYTPAEGTNANTDGYNGNFGNVTITRKSDQADVTSRFTITKNPGKLIINKKAVTVTAENKSKVYGEENPPLTYTESGFVGRDSLATLNIVPTLTTTAVQNSPVGEYPITFSNTTAETPNYTITYEGATLTVTGSATVTVDLSKLIQKELTLKEGSSLPQNATFKVKVTKDGATPIVGETANTNESTSWAVNGMTYTAPFNFSGSLTLQKGQTYFYQVTEDKNNPVSGVEYDPTTYQLKIEAKMDGTYSASYTATGDVAEATVTPATPLTIKNTYQTPYLTVTKKPYMVNNVEFKPGETVAHVGEQIVWKVSVKNDKTTQASTQLKDTLGGVTVYSDEKLQNSVNLGTDGTWTAMVPANTTVTYYVTYTVKPGDIPNGKIVNTIVKDGDNNIPSDAPVSTWDTKQLKSKDM